MLSPNLFSNGKLLPLLIGKPGVLSSVGLQRVGCDWVTELMRANVFLQNQNLWESENDPSMFLIIRQTWEALSYSLRLELKQWVSKFVEQLLYINICWSNIYSQSSQCLKLSGLQSTKNINQKFHLCIAVGWWGGRLRREGVCVCMYIYIFYIFIYIYIWIYIFIYSYKYIWNYDWVLIPVVWQKPMWNCKAIFHQWKINLKIK